MHGLLLQAVLSTVQEEAEEHVGDYQNLPLFKDNAHLGELPFCEAGNGWSSKVFC